MTLTQSTLTLGLALLGYAGQAQPSSPNAGDLTLPTTALNAITGPEFVIPNAFTPDADGMNDLFVFQAYGFETIEFQVYARNGQRVFQTTSPDHFWDGTLPSGEPAPQGVYVYYIVGTTQDNLFRDQAGQITVLR